MDRNVGFSDTSKYNLKLISCRFVPLSSIIIHYHPLFIHYHPLSSIIIHYHPLSSIIIHYHPLSSILPFYPVIYVYIPFQYPVSLLVEATISRHPEPTNAATAPHITTFDAVGAGAAGAGGPLPLPAAAAARALRASRPEGNQKVGGFDGI